MADTEDAPKPEKLEPGEGSFGGWLRRQREVRDITLREIADDSKISLRYLQALEEDRFDLLPAPVFAKGFLRQYARYVGLDPEDVVNYYLSVRGAGEAEAEEAAAEAAVRAGSGVPWLWLLVVVVAVALVLAALTYLPRIYGEDSTEEPPAGVGPSQGLSASAPPVAPVTAPDPVVSQATADPTVATADATAGTPVDVPLRVTIQFDDECWIEASVDGRRTISELRVQGEALQLEAQEEVRLTLGNAGAVRVEVNGRAYDLGRPAGEVVRDLRIDLEAARELAGTGAF